MYSLNYMGQTITCETAGEVMDLVYETARKAGATTTRATTPRATKGKGRTTPTAAEKRKRNAKARAASKAKKEAQPTTTAETHHGSAPGQTPPKEKQRRPDTQREVIAVLRRSGLAMTIPEIRDDLQKAGWKYEGGLPHNVIRSTLNRLGAKGTVARGHHVPGGEITFMIARVERADPLPHQQRESDAG